jgi:TetR/AcrR family transcriptional regulator
MVTRTNEASASRGQILAAASRLFAARGFDATSLQEIADALGMTKQAVLHHFRSKDQLRQAVLDDILGHWRDALPRLLFAATASEDRFDAVFGELHRFFAAEPVRARLLVREALDRPAEVKKLLRGPVRPWMLAVASYIRQGQASGKHFADADPEAYVSLITLFVISAVSSAALSQASMPTTGDDGADVADRWSSELARIAKTALFPPRADAPARVPPRPESKDAPARVSPRPESKGVTASKTAARKPRTRSAPRAVATPAPRRPRSR